MESSGKIDPQTFLLAMYKEQCDQARQHENLRQQSTTIVLTLSAAIVTAVTATAPYVIGGLRVARMDWMFALYSVFGLLVIVLGRFGRTLSLKHYERNRMHTDRAAVYRRELERLFPEDRYGKALRQRAVDLHRENWAAEAPKGAADMPDTRLYAGWLRIYSFVVWSGVLLFVTPLLVAILTTFFLAQRMPNP